MSETIEPIPPIPPTPPEPPKPVDSIIETGTLKAKEIVSVVALILAGLALGAALWMYLHDGTQAPLIGAISMLLLKGGTIIDFWLGSSDSSQKKDAVIASQLAAPPPPIPPTPPLPPTPPHI